MDILFTFSDEKIKKLLKGFKNISIDHFDEGSFVEKLSLSLIKKFNMEYLLVGFFTGLSLILALGAQNVFG